VALLKILTLGAPILRSKAAPVRTFDESLARLADDLHETMDAAPGVGLAAPQVGKLVRLVVFRAGEEGERGTLVNPEIAWSSDEKVELEEGCLSIPGQYFPVSRPAAVRVRAQELAGGAVEREVDGLLARIFQHEIDHLDGVLFIDRLTAALRREAMRALREQDFGTSPPPRPREGVRAL
jgi:peptide deformylase